jgi:phosphoribosylamine--glycine ligase
VRILILDPQGNALDWAMRCQAAEHQVLWYVPQKPRLIHIGQGLVERVSAWQAHLRWADLVFCTDNTAYLAELHSACRALGSRGPLIVGATPRTAEWELDRTLGMGLCRKAGLSVPDFKEFTDYNAAIRYVKKEDRAFVSKPSGDADKALSYVAKTPEDMVYMLQRWQKLGKIKAPFILQEKINGVEMAVGGWFGPPGFARGWCENWEFKKLMDGDRGCNTGEQGTVLRYVAASRLADKVLKPFEQKLRAEGYCGYIDVNCIIDDKGVPWPLEFTMRPGWPTFNIQQVVHQGDPAQWLFDLAAGASATHAVLDLVATGVVLSIPDYPYNKFPLEDVTGIPVYGLKPSIMPQVHPCEMMLGKAPQKLGGAVLDDLPALVTAGTYILVASGTGDTVEEARRHAYQTMEKISLPNSPMYRGDIGRRLQHQLPLLHELNYARGLNYTET